MIAPGLAAFAVHALLHDDPSAVIGDDETVEVEVEAVLNRGAVDLRDQSARFCERRAVDAGPLANRHELVGRAPGVAAAAAADMDAELARTTAPARASARR